MTHIANIPPNRIVAIATPLVFAPLAGTVTALAARYLPGVELDEAEVTAAFITGATIALAKAGIWMKGWQEHERREEIVPADALEPADEVAGTTDADLDADFVLDADLDLDPDVDLDLELDDGDEPDEPLAELETAQTA